MSVYHEFCRLRDQLRPGEEAPQYTEEQALDLAILTHIGAKHIAQVTNLRGVLTKQLAEIENHEKVAYALRLETVQLKSILQRIDLNVNGDVAPSIRRLGLSVYCSHPDTSSAAALPHLTKYDVVALSIRSESMERLELDHSAAAVKDTTYGN